MLQQADSEAQIVNVKSDAEASFRKAIEIASKQQLKWLELRATTSLAWLLQTRGHRTACATSLKIALTDWQIFAALSIVLCQRPFSWPTSSDCGPTISPAAFRGCLR